MRWTGLRMESGDFLELTHDVTVHEDGSIEEHRAVATLVTKDGVTTLEGEPEP